MILSISTTMSPATDLGFLLHKHPDKAQSFDVAVGTAHVVWPEATPARSTVALLLEIDPIGLVRRKGNRGADGFSLAQYVNDRPYVASSMMSVALGKVFRTAMAGRCEARPELVQEQLPLEIRVPALPCRGGPDLAQRLFAPMGWRVDVSPIPLDPQFPAWGDSPYVELRLTGQVRLADALSHLYVLLPVLDDSKHYWVSTDEVDKLLRAGAGWLTAHPERELITRRYLKHQRELVLSAVGRLAEVDDAEPEQLDNAVPDEPDEPDEAPPQLGQLRKRAVLDALAAEGAATVVDLGCGEGSLLRELIGDPAFTKVLGVDVSHKALEIATRRLGLERMPDSQRTRLELIQSSVTYRDDRLGGHDAVVLMEVIEHIDPGRLPALERSVFGHARPTSVVVTTPNAEYNVRYESLAAGTMRHRDHRFEWTRTQFRDWAVAAAAAYDYTVRFLPVGAEDTELGSPTQLAVFRKSV